MGELHLCQKEALDGAVIGDIKIVKDSSSYEGHQVQLGDQGVFRQGTILRLDLNSFLASILDSKHKEYHKEYIRVLPIQLLGLRALPENGKKNSIKFSLGLKKTHYAYWRYRFPVCCTMALWSMLHPKTAAGRFFK